MTLVVGIKCRDGVVIAADSAATMGDSAGSSTIGQQEVTKVHKLGAGGIFAATGSIGMAQMLCDQVGAWCDANLTRVTSEVAMMQSISEQVRSVALPQIQAATASVPLVGQRTAGMAVLGASLVAVVAKKQCHLIQFDFKGAPELATTKLPFVALGSGQPIADPFLAFLRRVLWDAREPTVADGRLVACWTVNHVCQTNAGGVGPPVQMATLTLQPNGAPNVDFTADVDGHVEQVLAAEGALSDFVNGRSPRAFTPEPPQRAVIVQQQATT